VHVGAGRCVRERSELCRARLRHVHGSQDWIEDLTGCTFKGETFADSLKDGVILCKCVARCTRGTPACLAPPPLPPSRRLANRIKPGSVPKINEPATMPFKKMENIANYLKAVRGLGMKEFEMFGTPDLFDEKNVPQVG